MARREFYQDPIGRSGVFPQNWILNTDDSFATITTAGYMNQFLSSYQFSSGDTVTVKYADNTGEFVITKSGANYSLQLDGGDVILPVVSQRIAQFVNSDGSIGEVAGTATHVGNIAAGIPGTAGSFISYPPTASKGTFRFTAQNNTGNTDTTVQNAAMGQATTITVPDPGAATANFLLDAGAANLITYQEMIPLENARFVGTAGAPVWTMTRVAQSNYAWVHTVAADTTIVSFDITGWVRTAASKGFRLQSIDFIYAIGAAAVPLTNSFTLDLVNYVDNAAVAVTAIGVSSLTLPFAAQANPYVVNRTVSAPAFDNTAVSKYVVEWTVATDTTTLFSINGLNVNFTQTIA